MNEYNISFLRNSFTIRHVIWKVNILVRWNRTSWNLEISVPALGNHLFCAWWLIHFYWNIGQDLVASAVRSSLYQCLNKNYASVCTKANLKSDFHTPDRWWISLRIIHYIRSNCAIHIHFIQEDCLMNARQKFTRSIFRNGRLICCAKGQRTYRQTIV